MWGPGCQTPGPVHRICVALRGGDPDYSNVAQKNETDRDSLPLQGRRQRPHVTSICHAGVYVYIYIYIYKQIHTSSGLLS